MVPALACINQFCNVCLCVYLLLVVLVPRGCNSLTSPSASLWKSLPFHLPLCTPSGSTNSTATTIDHINLFYKVYTSLHDNPATVHPPSSSYPQTDLYAFIFLVLVGDLCPWHCWHRLNTCLIGPLPILSPYFPPPSPHLLSIICYLDGGGRKRHRVVRVDGWTIVQARWRLVVLGSCRPGFSFGIDNINTRLLLYWWHEIDKFLQTLRQQVSHYGNYLYKFVYCYACCFHYLQLSTEAPECWTGLNWMGGPIYRYEQANVLIYGWLDNRMDTLCLM